MAHVWEARHEVIGHSVAFKVLRSEVTADPSATERVLRGARNAGRLRHPNVCLVFDVGTLEDGGCYLALEFVDGATLQSIVDRDGRLAVLDALRVTVGITRALVAAHSLGIIHRDLKPDNVMLQGGRMTAEAVKVVDFDIARAPQDESDVDITQPLDTIGTPQYMSPEQCRGQALDPRSDLYSLGLVLYRMLSGTLPFSGRNTREVMVSRLIEDPRPLADAAPDLRVPTALTELVDRLLARKPENRIASAASVEAALVRIIELLVHPDEGPEAASEEPAQGSRGRVGFFQVAALGAGSVLLLGTGLGWMLLGETGPTMQPGADLPTVAPPPAESRSGDEVQGPPGNPEAIAGATLPPTPAGTSAPPVEDAGPVDIGEPYGGTEPEVRQASVDFSELPRGPEVSVVILPQDDALGIDSEVESFLELLGSVLARGDESHLRAIYPGVLERELEFWLEDMRAGVPEAGRSVSLSPRAVTQDGEGRVELRVLLVTVLSEGEPVRAFTVRARLEHVPEQGFRVLELLRL
jgi:tRNA A-37 threonylcarbamoyl transferase component Bud32